MAEKHLGAEFEIHGGGLDLRFPHHENELAQSSALGHRFAHIWMHNGMLELDAEKMSKSLGNVVTLRNVLDTWGREALLVFHLSGHWSKPVDFSDEAMDAAARARRAFATFPRRRAGAGGCLGALRRGARRRLRHPAALAVMHELARPRALLRRALGLRARVARRARTRRRPRSSRSRAAGRGMRRARLRRGRSPARRDRGGRLGRARRSWRPVPARPAP